MSGVRAQVTAPAWVGLVGAVLLAVAAFPHSARTMLAALGSDDPLAMVAAAPLLTLACAMVAVRRSGPSERPRTEPAMLVAVPLAVVVGVLVLMGPARLGFAYWVDRYDLVAFTALALAGIVLAVGVRAPLGRFGVAWIAILSLPPIVLPILGIIERSLVAGTRRVAETLAQAVHLGVTSGSDGRFVTSGGEQVAITAACAGTSGVLGVALVAGPLVVGTSGSGRRKLLVVIAALGAAVTLNVVRVVLLLWLAGSDRERAFDAVHAGAGTVIVAVVSAGMLLGAGRAGLRWEHLGSLRQRVTYGRRHLVGAGIVLAPVAALTVWMQMTDAGAALRASTVETRVELTALPGDTPPLEVSGAEVRLDEELRWFRPFFGEDSESATYTIDRSGETEPVWAQVVVAGSRRQLRSYGPLECFVAHGARIFRVRAVPLPGGSGTLVEQRMRGVHFSALTFTQPVRRADGGAAWRRIVLFARTEPGGRGGDDRYSRPDGALQRAAFGVLNALSPMPTEPTPGVSFGPANRLVTRTAERILSGA